MHPLIDKGIVDLIRDTGNTSENLPNRVEVMEQNNLPIDQNADNVIITGCQVIGAMPPGTRHAGPYPGTRRPVLHPPFQRVLLRQQPLSPGGQGKG